MLDVHARGGVTVATLNQPERGNCLSDAMVAALSEVIDQAEGREDTAVLVIRGQPSVFCGGGDVKVFRRWSDWTAADRKSYIENVIQPLFRRLRDSPLLSVACVSGAVVGAGLDLLLACDLRFAAASAGVRSGYLGAGLVPGAGSPWHLVRQVGSSRALELLLSQEEYPARELATWGMFNCVYEDEALWPAVEALCANIASHGRARVSALRSLTRLASSETFSGHLEHAAAVLAVLGESRPPQPPAI
jgi:2-(1,2-epoxy-1,2-dihydrophenyl)acetyl-CoA isomerase